MTNFQLGCLLLATMAFGATLYAIYRQDGWRVYTSGIMATLFCGSLALPSDPLGAFFGLLVVIAGVTWLAYLGAGKKVATGVGVAATLLIVGAIQYTIGWF